MSGPTLRSPWRSCDGGVGNNSYAKHMGGQPKRPDSSKEVAAYRSVDTSPIYGRRQATSGTIDREISESIQSYREQAKQARIAAAIARQSKGRS